MSVSVAANEPCLFKFPQFGGENTEAVAMKQKCCIGATDLGVEIRTITAIRDRLLNAPDLEYVLFIAAKLRSSVAPN